MADHDSTTGRAETLDDWLKEWDHHGAWHTKAAEVQRLVDEVRRLREQNTGLGVRIQQAWQIQERLEDEIRTLRGIAQRLFMDWKPYSLPDGLGWSKGFHGPDRCILMTPEELAAWKEVKAE